VSACSFGWEALRSDPLPWLLDPNRPNLHWRVLVELVRRPATSPAVIRSRGGANASEPVASLLAALHPDGSWETPARFWQMYSGPGWRLVAAVQWGADPSDPRLHAAAERLLEIAPGEGGFALREGEAPVPWLTARALHTLAELGWCRHARFQEGLAWLQEEAPRSPTGGWRVVNRRTRSGECAVTAVALLAALTACDQGSREVLSERAVASLERTLAAKGGLGHPCFGRTDSAEILWALARAEMPLTPGMVQALGQLQRTQDAGARWRRSVRVPSSLPADGVPGCSEPSGWLTLKAVVALMHFAVAAKLPRLYPEKP